ncbi:unnamed protein product [Adineta steineri]|uniref:GH26 domain-containing protein n=1 Tax=Adineta steineri TaxID=433720 RepID=A0A819IGB7_9BILA|nr:unnamed protein product [Adineta steineri]CAF3913430.1 unnamed protein product [Adineta steineri]
MMDSTGNLSLWVGKRQASIDIYTDWCDNSLDSFFDLDMNSIWNRSMIPFITWEITLCNHTNEDDSGITIRINNNSYDPYINKFGDRMKNWLAGPDGIYGTNDDRRAFVRLGHEMNGNWYSWSKGSIPNNFVLAWRHTYNILLNKGINATRLQWVWSVASKDYGQYTAEDYWVGANYTDWLGINVFNAGSSANGSKWEWPNEILDNMMGRFNKLSSTKPISVNAYATVGVRTGNTTDVQSKNEWLRQMCDYINNNNIKMASYYNADQPTQDNMVFGGTHGDVIWNNYKAYSAYRNCLQTNDWIEPNMNNPRLITDKQFTGEGKKRVVKETGAIGKIYDNELAAAAFTDAALALAPLPIDAKSSLNRLRRQTTPTLPKSSIFDVPDAYSITTNGA